MDVLTWNILLEYLYKKFAVTFVLSLMGSFLKQSTLGTKKVNRISIASILSPTIFSTVLLCAIIDYLNIPFSVYAVVCVLVGMWSSTILKLFLNIIFIKKLVVLVLKNLSGPLAEYSKKLADELEEESKDNTEDSSNTPDEHKDE